MNQRRALREPWIGSAKDLLDRLWTVAGAVGAQSPGQFDFFLGYVGRIVELQQERVMVRAPQP